MEDSSPPADFHNIPVRVEYQHHYWEVESGKVGGRDLGEEGRQRGSAFPAAERTSLPEGNTATERLKHSPEGAEGPRTRAQSPGTWAEDLFCPKTLLRGLKQWNLVFWFVKSFLTIIYTTLKEFYRADIFFYSQCLGRTTCLLRLSVVS